MNPHLNGLLIQSGVNDSIGVVPEISLTKYLENSFHEALLGGSDTGTNAQPGLQEKVCTKPTR